MSRGSNKQRDPRGHSLRIYSDIYDSPAFKALSPMDVLAYLGLLRQLKGYNNGDISLPLTKAREFGISHHLTLARSLRALCAVGLVAITRKGGSTKGGQRLPNLYRLTDRECFAIPAKILDAIGATNEWKLITSVEQGLQRIADAHGAVKKVGEKKSLGRRMTTITSPRVLIEPKVRTQSDTWDEQLGHEVTVVETAENPISTRTYDGFEHDEELSRHGTRHVSPIYIATPTDELPSLASNVVASKRISECAADKPSTLVAAQGWQEIAGSEPASRKELVSRAAEWVIERHTKGRSTYPAIQPLKNAVDGITRVSDADPLPEGW